LGGVKSKGGWGPRVSKVTECRKNRQGEEEIPRPTRGLDVRLNGSGKRDVRAKGTGGTQKNEKE